MTFSLFFFRFKVLESGGVGLELNFKKVFICDFFGVDMIENGIFFREIGFWLFIKLEI